VVEVLVIAEQSRPTGKLINWQAGHAGRLGYIPSADRDGLGKQALRTCRALRSLILAIRR